MPLKVDQFPGEPIVVFRFVSPSQPAADAELMRQSLLAAQPSAAGMLYFITDFTEAELSFSELMVGMAEFTHHIARDLKNKPFKAATVGTSEMIRLMAEAGRQEQYGSLEVPFYPTLSEALDYIRSQIAAE